VLRQKSEKTENRAVGEVSTYVKNRTEPKPNRPKKKTKLFYYANPPPPKKDVYREEERLNLKKVLNGPVPFRPFIALRKGFCYIFLSFKLNIASGFIVNFLRKFYGF